MENCEIVFHDISRHGDGEIAVSAGGVMLTATQANKLVERLNSKEGEAVREACLAFLISN